MIWYIALVVIMAIAAGGWLMWEYRRAVRRTRELEDEMRRTCGYVPTINELLARSYPSDLELARRKNAARDQERRQMRQRYANKARELSRHHRALNILPGYVYLLRDDAGLYGYSEHASQTTLTARRWRLCGLSRRRPRRRINAF